MEFPFDLMEPRTTPPSADEVARVRQEQAIDHLVDELMQHGTVPGVDTPLVPVLGARDPYDSLLDAAFDGRPIPQGHQGTTVPGAFSPFVVPLSSSPPPRPSSPDASVQPPVVLGGVSSTSDSEVTSAWAWRLFVSEHERRAKQWHAVVDNDTRERHQADVLARWRDRAPCVEMALLATRHGGRGAEDVWSLHADDAPNGLVYVRRFPLESTADTSVPPVTLVDPQQPPPQRLQALCTLEWDIHTSQEFERMITISQSAKSLWPWLQREGGWYHGVAQGPIAARLLTLTDTPSPRALKTASSRVTLARRVLNTLHTCATALATRSADATVSVHELALYECQTPLFPPELRPESGRHWNHMPRAHHVTQTPAATVLWTGFATLLVPAAGRFPRGPVLAIIDWPGSKLQHRPQTPQEYETSMEPGTSQLGNWPTVDSTSSYTLPAPDATPAEWMHATARVQRALDFLHQTALFAEAARRLHDVQQLPAALAAAGEHGRRTLGVWRRACTLVGCAVERLWFEFRACVRAYTFVGSVPPLPKGVDDLTSPPTAGGMTHVRYWTELGETMFHAPGTVPPPQHRSGVVWTHRVLTLALERELFRLAAIRLDHVRAVPLPPVVPRPPALPLCWHVWLHLLALTPRGTHEVHDESDTMIVHGVDVRRAARLWREAQPAPRAADVGSEAMRVLLGIVVGAAAERNAKRARAQGRRRRRRT